MLKRFCDNCEKELGIDFISTTKKGIFPYGHNEKDFCSSKCVAEFFKKEDEKKQDDNMPTMA
jgi:hypothetical protein